MGDGQFALGRSGGFLDEWWWNFTSTSNGINLASQCLNVFLDGNDAVELGAR
jgi:hypothetical protein